MITDSKLLKGQSEIVTLTQFRKTPGDFFTQVQMGKVLTVTKMGKAIATVTQPELTAQELGTAVRKMKSGY